MVTTWILHDWTSGKGKQAYDNFVCKSSSYKKSFDGEKEIFMPGVISLDFFLILSLSPMFHDYLLKLSIMSFS